MNEDEYSKKEKEDRPHEKSEQRYHEIDRDHQRRVGLGALGAILILVVVFMLGRATKVGFGNNRTERAIKSVNINGDDFDGMMDRRDNGMMDGGWVGRGKMGEGSAQNTRISGEVTAINDNKVTVKENDDTEYVVNISADTSYRKNSSIAKQSDLKTGNKVLVTGTSNSNGELVASLIVIE